ncbi:hypothetical protein N0V95_008368 [Ascochyta clinopodiicola]|nr:hypothetical protein N0V95_008368 [Ascochyta clinopodiicola]
MSDFSTANTATPRDSMDAAIDGVTDKPRNDTSTPQEMPARLSEDANHDPEPTASEIVATDYANYKQPTCCESSDELPEKDFEGESTSNVEQAETNDEFPVDLIGGGKTCGTSPTTPAPVEPETSAKQHGSPLQTSEAPKASKNSNSAAQSTRRLHSFGKIRTVSNCITEQAYTIEETVVYNNVSRKVSRIGLGIADFDPDKLRARVAREVSGDRGKAKMLEEVIAGLKAQKRNFQTLREDAQKVDKSSEQPGGGVGRSDKGSDEFGEGFKEKMRKGSFDTL